MDVIVTVFSSVAAMLVIAVGLAVQAGAGGAIARKLDHLFEQRFAPRAIVVDVEPQHKNQRS